ncbi:MAG: thiamine pyrophosphate-binding protein, partial [Longimicrobiales bacterium]
VLLLGQGSQEASPEVGDFVARVGSAVISNSSGRGVLREDHPNLLCGDFSGWGVELVNELIAEADVVLTLGCKLSFNGSSGYRLAIPADKLIHVDASRENLGRTYPAGISVEGSVGAFLADVLAHTVENGGAGTGWTPQELMSWKRRFQERSVAGSGRFPVFSNGGDLGPFFQALRQSLRDDAVVVTDSGLHQVVTRRLLEVRAPRGLIIPSDFQSMGFGLPAAIGAALSSPGRDVVAIVGDGGFAMSGLELLTAVREGLDLKVFVFSDGHLGQIRQQQLREFGHAYATALGPLDLEGFSEAVGASYLAMDGDEMDVLEEVVENRGVTIVELLLGDPPGTGRDRRKALAKATARRLLGPSVVNTLKRAKAALAGDRRSG